MNFIKVNTFPNYYNIKSLLVVSLTHSLFSVPKK